jgi:hypothetical protein
MSMVAGVETIRGFCPIRWVGRKGLSVKAITYCNDEVNVADGVLQVPATLLKEGVTASVRDHGKLISCCPKCKQGLPAAMT